MGKEKKKAIRADFRDAVFRRDGYRCKVCGVSSNERALDAHHITSRKLMPNGGYCLENGITLCNRPGGCHEKAEAFDWFSNIVTGYDLPTLYNLIGSSYLKAFHASTELNGSHE